MGTNIFKNEINVLKLCRVRQREVWALILTRTSCKNGMCVRDGTAVSELIVMDCGGLRRGHFRATLEKRELVRKNKSELNLLPCPISRSVV